MASPSPLGSLDLFLSRSLLTSSSRCWRVNSSECFSSEGCLGLSTDADGAVQPAAAGLLRAAVLQLLPSFLWSVALAAPRAEGSSGGRRVKDYCLCSSCVLWNCLGWREEPGGKHCHPKASWSLQAGKGGLST